VAVDLEHGARRRRAPRAYHAAVTPPPARARSPWRRRLAALALGLGLPALALELGVRLVHGAPLGQREPLQLVETSALRGWRHVPDRDFHTFDQLASINALGLRGPQVLPRAPGELRVVALGDSMTFGVGVADDDTLPAALERELEALRAGPVTVFNTGHASYSTNQEVALLHELGDVLDPDVVVLMWFFNDLVDEDVASRAAHLAAVGPSAFETQGPFEGWPATRWRIGEALRTSAVLSYVHWQQDYRRHGRFEGFERGFESLPTWLDLLEARCRELGAQLFVVVIPFSASLARDNACRPLEERAVELFRARGLATFETRAALEAALPDLGRVPHVRYDYHYDATGNAVQARAVAQWLAPLVASEPQPSDD
jgi:hypothetical protein